MSYLESELMLQILLIQVSFDVIICVPLFLLLVDFYFYYEKNIVNWLIVIENPFKYDIRDIKSRGLLATMTNAT